MDDSPSDMTYPNLVELTAEVVSAYVSHNSVHKSDLQSLIAAVHSSLSDLGRPAAPTKPERPAPMVPIKKSVTPDYIVSLEDGRHYKSLKRHLNGRGLTPDQYRERWGLPHDYPMVAPNYARQRSELAKSMGLGRHRQDNAVEETPAPSRKPRRAASA